MNSMLLWWIGLAQTHRRVIGANAKKLPTSSLSFLWPDSQRNLCLLGTGNVLN